MCAQALQTPGISSALRGEFADQTEASTALRLELEAEKERRAEAQRDSKIIGIQQENVGDVAKFYSKKVWQNLAYS